jgi:hypothetical protein
MAPTRGGKRSPDDLGVVCRENKIAGGILKALPQTRDAKK